MKKMFLLLTFLLLSSPLTTTCSTDNLDNEDHQELYEDEFDSLIEEALEKEVIKKDVSIPEPSKFATLLQKVGITLFLKPYIFMVTKYRNSKKIITEYAKKLLVYFGMKAATDGQSE